MNSKRAIPHQITVQSPVGLVTKGYDPETLEGLKDKKHIEAVRKSREEYRRGEAIDTKEFLKKLAS